MRRLHKLHLWLGLFPAPGSRGAHAIALTREGKVARDAQLCKRLATYPAGASSSERQQKELCFASFERRSGPNKLPTDTAPAKRRLLAMAAHILWGI